MTDQPEEQSLPETDGGPEHVSDTMSWCSWALYQARVAAGKLAPPALPIPRLVQPRRQPSEQRDSDHG